MHFIRGYSAFEPVFIESGINELKFRWKKEEVNNYSKKRRELLKNSGICTTCGHREAIPGQTKCEFCIRRMRDYHKAAYTSRVEAGLCGICGKNKKVSNGIICAECRKKNSERKKALRKKRIEEKQCVRCGKDVLSGQQLCEKCLIKAREASRISQAKRRMLKKCAKT